MATWWITEAIPLLATALVPLIVFTLAQTQTFAETARPYASGTIFLFLGGFFLAAAVQKWNLHRRIALNVVKVVGTKPKMIVLGFMLATGFITMWVSNTATAIMMLPIGLSVLHLIDGGKKGSELLHSNFAKALMLGIAYSASIVATSSLISTPPNALLRACMLDNYGITLTFGRWLVFAAPMAWIFLLIAWHLLVNVFFKPEMDDIPGGHELIVSELRQMGPMSRGEKLVAMVFVLAALSWLFLPMLFGHMGVTDELIAMVISLLLFLIPAGPDQRLLDAKTAPGIPWEILLLFGGGLALSSAFTNSGLSTWIGDLSQGLGGMGVVVLVLAVTILVMALTEMTSNTATAATFLPVLGGCSSGHGSGRYVAGGTGCTGLHLLIHAAGRDTTQRCGLLDGLYPNEGHVARRHLAQPDRHRSDYSHHTHHGTPGSRDSTLSARRPQEGIPEDVQAVHLVGKGPVSTLFPGLIPQCLTTRTDRVLLSVTRGHPHLATQCNDCLPGDCRLVCSVTPHKVGEPVPLPVAGRWFCLREFEDVCASSGCFLSHDH